jgi:hypothetical protein
MKLNWGLQNLPISCQLYKSCVKFNNKKWNTLRRHDNAQIYRILCSVVLHLSQHNHKISRHCHIKKASANKIIIQKEAVHIHNPLMHQTSFIRAQWFMRGLHKTKCDFTTDCHVYIFGFSHVPHWLVQVLHPPNKSECSPFWNGSS